MKEKIFAFLLLIPLLSFPVNAAKEPPQIALTFDDGPSAHTQRLLDYLKENHVRATFFLVGSRVPYYPETVQRQFREGHELGYHSYHHQDQTCLSSRQIRHDYSLADQQLQEITGSSYTLWRCPGGTYDKRVLNSVPLPHICWSVDTMDWKTRNADAVCSAILENARDGAIILLHDLYGTSVDGVIRAIQILQKQNYEFLTVSELLSRDGTPPQNAMTYFQN